MKFNGLHLIYIPFTGLGKFGGYRGDSWFKERIRIFKDFTVKSLQNQTEKDFIVWISFRKEEQNNPLTEEITTIMKESGLNYVMTFSGIAMWDDRGVEHNDDLLERLGKTIEGIRTLFIKKEYVYITNFSSDDMLEKDAVSLIQSEEYKERKAIYFMNGFVYNEQTNQLAEWNRDSAGAQYTIMYPKEKLMDANKWFGYEMACLKSHEYIPQCFDAKCLEDWKFMCIVHGFNISTGWNNSFRGKELFYEDEKQKILSNFGIKNA